MKWLLISFVIFIGTFFFGTAAHAAPSQLLITEIRLGGDEVMSNGVGYKQYAVIHNQDEAAIDLSTWRIQYAKASYTGDCQALNWSSEVVLSGTIAPGASVVVPYQLTDNAAGALRVIDGASVVHDTVGWGDAVCFEAQPADTLPANNQSIARYAACDGMYGGADTNNNADDFGISDSAFEVKLPAECQPSCLPNQQLVNGICIDDQCDNLDGLQAAVPDGYQKDGTRCIKALLPLNITELLPNSAGSDAGKEFIELYNPQAQSINLKEYMLGIGTKHYPLPDELLAAGEYRSFSDTELGFTLPNTSTIIGLRSDEGAVLFETPAYVSPKDDEAWAFIQDTWQFTNQPTPGRPNLPSLSDEKGNGSVGGAETKPCAANQYRSPETNRCRLAEASTSEPTPCKEGQYRSEETNRCRNSVLAASTLTPCKEGQYRSEETNRCRSIAASGSNELAPCKEGQERNPETNRCRAVQAGQPGKADYAVEPVKETATAFTGWWALGGVGALALGKIGWEWREEIINAVRKAGLFFTSGK